MLPLPTPSQDPPLQRLPLQNANVRIRTYACANTACRMPALAICTYTHEWLLERVSPMLRVYAMRARALRPPIVVAKLGRETYVCEYVGDAAAREKQL